MLDTNAVTAIARGRDARLQGLVATRPVCLSVLVEAELRYGLARRPVHADVRRIIETLLDGVEVRPWHSACARRYASLRAALEQDGLPLSPVDLLIASHAIAEACTLVTADRAFARVPGLQMLDWTADPGH